MSRLAQWPCFSSSAVRCRAQTSISRHRRFAVPWGVLHIPSVPSPTAMAFGAGTFFYFFFAPLGVLGTAVINNNLRSPSKNEVAAGRRCAGARPRASSECIQATSSRASPAPRAFPRHPFSGGWGQGGGRGGCRARPRRGERTTGDARTL